jgi:hypothetical protein
VTFLAIFYDLAQQRALWVQMQSIFAIYKELIYYASYINIIKLKALNSVTYHKFQTIKSNKHKKGLWRVTYRKKEEEVDDCDENILQFC